MILGGEHEYVNPVTPLGYASALKGVSVTIDDKFLVVSYRTICTLYHFPGLLEYVSFSSLVVLMECSSHLW